MNINDVSGTIVSSAIKVHTALGPGVFESAYEACLALELRKRGLSVELQKPLPIIYDGVRLDAGYRIDLLVEQSVVVELKAVAKILVVHRAQLLSYLRLGGFKLGLLLNFHEVRMKDGVVRIVN